MCSCLLNFRSVSGFNVFQVRCKLAEARPASVLLVADYSEVDARFRSHKINSDVILCSCLFLITKKKSRAEKSGRADRQALIQRASEADLSDPRTVFSVVEPEKMFIFGAKFLRYQGV